MKRAALVIVIVFALGGYVAGVVHEAVTGPLIKALG